MKKTVVSHFYNEEWLLPFWLKHHRNIFDHGIMIDYHSTDRSCEIINELCPNWEIHKSSNITFQDVSAIDKEVSHYEAQCTGWRMSLNIPEFLIGNYNRLADLTEQTRYYIGQYMFTDMERDDEPKELNATIPIYEQRQWGYGLVTRYEKQLHNSPPRPPRSVHNYAAGYPISGRHFWKNTPSFTDLVIFYYGFGSIEEASLQRRLQIQTQIPNKSSKTAPGSHHIFDKKQLLEKFREEQQPLSRNLKQEIVPIIELHKQLTGQEF